MQFKLTSAFIALGLVVSTVMAAPVTDVGAAEAAVRSSGFLRVFMLTVTKPQDTDIVFIYDGVCHRTNLNSP